MKIRTKLLLNSAITVFLFGVVATFGIRAINDFNRQFEEVNRYIVPKTRAIEDLRYAASTIVASTSEYVLLVSEAALQNGAETALKEKSAIDIETNEAEKEIESEIESEIETEELKLESGINAYYDALRRYEQINTLHVSGFKPVYSAQLG